MVFANNLVITFMELWPKKSQMHYGLVPKQHGGITSHLKISSRPNVLIITILRLQMFTMLYRFIYSTTSELVVFYHRGRPKYLNPYKSILINLRSAGFWNFNFVLFFNFCPQNRPLGWEEKV